MNVHLQLFAKAEELAEEPVQQPKEEKEEAFFSQRWKELAPVLELLGKKYGIAADEQGNFDPALLKQALEAEQKPATDSLEARLTRLEQNYAARLRGEKQRQQQEQAKAIYAQWKQQEQQARELYPKLSLQEELQDPRFVDLLKSGVDVRTAFEVIHKDEIVSASMHYAAQEVERRLTNKLIADSHRPGENGSTHGPAVSKVDVSRMTRQERRDIARRARMGETITF